MRSYSSWHLNRDRSPDRGKAMPSSQIALHLTLYTLHLTLYTLRPTLYASNGQSFSAVLPRTHSRSSGSKKRISSRTTDRVCA